MGGSMCVCVCVCVFMCDCACEGEAAHVQITGYIDWFKTRVTASW